MSENLQIALAIVGGLAFLAFTFYLFHKGWREENEE